MKVVQRLNWTFNAQRSDKTLEQLTLRLSLLNLPVPVHLEWHFVTILMQESKALMFTIAFSALLSFICELVEPAVQNYLIRTLRREGCPDKLSLIGHLDPKYVCLSSSLPLGLVTRRGPARHSTT